MIIIGLCGGSGSGKGVVAELFASHGIPSVDADAVYRDLIYAGSPLLNRIKDAFGESVLLRDGSLDRKTLSSIVFSNKEKLMLLNKITHSAIIQEAEIRFSQYKKLGYPAIIFDAPQLFESGFNKKCDIIIAVTAPIDLRIERLIKRDNKSKASILERLAAQLPDEFLISNSDYILENKGDIKSLSDEIDKLVKIILK